MFSMNQPLNPPLVPPLGAPAVQQGHQQAMQQQGSSTSSSSTFNTVSADEQSNPAGMVGNQGSQSNNLLEQLQQAQGTYFASLQQINAQHQALLVMDRTITSYLLSGRKCRPASSINNDTAARPRSAIRIESTNSFTQTSQQQSGTTPQMI